MKVFEEHREQSLEACLMAGAAPVMMVNQCSTMCGMNVRGEVTLRG